MLCYRTVELCATLRFIDLLGNGSFDTFTTRPALDLMDPLTLRDSATILWAYMKYFEYPG